MGTVLLWAWHIMLPSRRPRTFLIHNVPHMLDGRGFGRQDDLTLHNLGPLHNPHHLGNRWRVGVGWRRVRGRVARRCDGSSRHSAGWHGVCRHRAALHCRAGDHRIVVVPLHDKESRIDSGRIGVACQNACECARSVVTETLASSRHRVAHTTGRKGV